MRKYLAIVALVLASSAASAQTESADESVEYCKSLSGLASSIMGLRQDGVPMSRLMEQFAKVQNDYSRLTKLMVISAYEEPRFTSSEYRQRAITDFEDRNYLACMKAELRSGRQ